MNVKTLAQMISTKTIAAVIIDDAEVCAVLDSGVTADLMTHAEARGFNITAITKLSN